MASNKSNAFDEFWDARGTGEKIAIVWLTLVVVGLVILGIWLITTPFAWIGWSIIGILVVLSACLALGYLAEENGW